MYTEHEGINVITAWCASDNIGSVKAMEKAGMKHISTGKNALKVDGVMYDKLIYE
ncbi:MAG: GNAT family N-acetyltransferase [Parasporobacterium sp.]|nr:GNAT family N-acetyltransferase [Parasporobacterium sp.]